MAYRAQYLILADQVQTIHNGKLNVLGVFDRFWPSEIPTTMNGFVVVALLVAENEDDLGEHTLGVRFVRPNGKVETETVRQIQIKPGEGGPFGIATVRMVIGMAQVPIRGEGTHRVELTADGEVIAAHPVAVKKRPPAVAP